MWGGGWCWPAGARPPSPPSSTSSSSSSSQTSGCEGHSHEEQKADEEVVVEALDKQVVQDEIAHEPTIGEELKRRREGCDRGSEGRREGCERGGV